MPDNVNITVNETTENVVINPSISTDVIDVNTYSTTENVNISVTPELTTININSVTSAEQVNSDWNATTGKALILNKPTIPSIAGLATTNYVDTKDDLKQDTLISGTNIKTIGGNSILNGGDLKLGIHTIIKPAIGQSTNSLINSGNFTTFTGVANRLTALPYIPAQNITCASLYINVNTALASSNARILIYSDLNGAPNTKLYESANLDCSTIGIKNAITTQTFLAGTIYWIGVHISSTQIFTAYQNSSIMSLPINGISIQCSVFKQAVTFGSAPTTFGSFTYSNSSVPYVGITL